MATQNLKLFEQIIKNELDLTLGLDISKLASIKWSQLGNVESYYTPFDHINVDAKVILVGITPGPTQLFNALKSIQSSLLKCEMNENALELAKQEGAFSGPLRKPLVEMLDHVGLNEKLGLESCLDLFGCRKDLVHTTSLLRYAVFVDGKPYNGSKPNMLKNDLMQKMINEYFLDEINNLPDAVIVPLGVKVAAVLKDLVNKGKIDETRVLSGVPHPSGQNAERIAYFLGRKDRNSVSKVNVQKADTEKELLKEKIALLSF